MSRSTISTFKVFEMWPDAETARLYLESRLWPSGPVCPGCNSGESVVALKRFGYYDCNSCRSQAKSNEVFTIRTGTIFERSKIPLNKWLYAMYLMMTARKSVSSLQIAKGLGITQKSAWFMMHRIREACGEDFFNESKEFESMIDRVLAFKPKPKSRAARKRKKRAAKSG